MALARQAQRCAVGKLDSSSGYSYCGDRDDPNDFQIARTNIPSKFVLNFWRAKTCLVATPSKKRVPIVKA